MRDCSVLQINFFSKEIVRSWANNLIYDKGGYANEAVRERDRVLPLQKQLTCLTPIVPGMGFAFRFKFRDWSSANSDVGQYNTVLHPDNISLLCGLRNSID